MDKFESPYGTIEIGKELSWAMNDHFRAGGGNIFGGASEKSNEIAEAIDTLALVAFEAGFGTDIKKLFK